MKNEGIIEGQINIFDLPIIEVIKHKNKITKEIPIIKTSKLDHIINLYSATCSRIVKTYSGALLVELENKTLYFNSDGVNEFELPVNVGIMPGEEILISNKEKDLNNLQKQKLEDLKPKEYIKRKGDANLIIPGEKTIVINPKGWVLEYMQKPKYHENEIFSTEFALKLKEVEDNITGSSIDITKNINDNVNFKVDDKVSIEYQSTKSIGRVVRIYNNGETLNVAWGGRRTAFYYKNVRKVE
jgi:hypothetical protein